MTRRSWFCVYIDFSQSSNRAYPGGFGWDSKVGLLRPDLYTELE